LLCLCISLFRVLFFSHAGKANRKVRVAGNNFYVWLGVELYVVCSSLKMAKKLDIQFPEWEQNRDPQFSSITKLDCVNQT
jgi:hypothetical protein